MVTMEVSFKSARLSYHSWAAGDDDLDFHLATMSDTQSDVNSDIGLPKPASRERVNERTKAVLQASIIALIICLNPIPSDRGKPTKVGFIILRNSGMNVLLHRRAEIGICLLKQFQGQGYGAEAIEWMCWYGFRCVGLNSISMEAAGWNERAVVLYQRLGFVLEGRRREALWHNGRFYDSIMLGMLLHEWEARQTPEEKVTVVSRDDD